MNKVTYWETKTHCSTQNKNTDNSLISTECERPRLVSRLTSPGLRKDTTYRCGSSTQSNSPWKYTNWCAGSNQTCMQNIYLWFIWIRITTEVICVELRRFTKNCTWKCVQDAKQFCGQWTKNSLFSVHKTTIITMESITK